MELPYNTTISRDLLKRHRASSARRRRLGHQAALGGARRSRRSRPRAITSAAPTPRSRIPSRTRFVYRDRLWQGADLVGLGVASFGHVNGVHVQNLDQWETYSAAVRRGELPLEPRVPAHGRGADDPRAGAPAEARLDPARLLPRQVRRGRARRASASRSARSPAEGYLAEAAAERVALTREGLLRADVLLRRFFLPQHSGIRYT